MEHHAGTSQNGPRPQSRQAQLGPLTMDGMRDHLQGVFIGFRAGDPTVGSLPAQPQFSSSAGQPYGTHSAEAPTGAPKVVRLRDWSMQQLMAEAAGTLTRDPFAELLPEPPGVPADRIAFVTGQEPERRRIPATSRPSTAAAPSATAAASPKPATAAAVAAMAAAPRLSAAATAPSSEAGAPAISAQGCDASSGANLELPVSRSSSQAKARGSSKCLLDDSELVAVLARHLCSTGGGGNDSGLLLWTELGMSGGGPQLQGKALDLRRLWELGSELGGWDSITANQKWSYLAGQMCDISRVTNGAFLIKSWYQRFLLPYEQHLRATGAWGTRHMAQLGAAAAGQAAMVDEGCAQQQQQQQQQQQLPQQEPLELQQEVSLQQQHPLLTHLLAQQLAQQQGGGRVAGQEARPLDVAALQTALAVARGQIGTLPIKQQ